MKNKIFREDKVYSQYQCMDSQDGLVIYFGGSSLVTKGLSGTLSLPYKNSVFFSPVVSTSHSQGLGQGIRSIHTKFSWF